MNETTLCSNQTCPLRLQCRRFTMDEALLAHAKKFEWKRQGAYPVCNQYMFNGQLSIN